MILSMLIGSALRSLGLAAGAWMLLKLLRVHHPHARMTVWTVVLGASITMPVLTPWIQLPIPVSASLTRLVPRLDTQRSVVAFPAIHPDGAVTSRALATSRPRLSSRPPVEPPDPHFHLW